MTKGRQAEIEQLPERKPWEIPIGGDEYGVDLEVYFGMLEREVGFSIVAYDVETDSGAYGTELVEQLEAEARRGEEQRDLQPSPGLTEETAQRLRAAEEELGYRLVGYHHGSDTVMWGGELLDELGEKYGVE